MSYETVPTSDKMNVWLDELACRIPNFQQTEELRELPRGGRWAAAIGSLNKFDPDISPDPFMVLAVLVVLDLTGENVRLTKPVLLDSFGIESVFSQFSQAMKAGMQGPPAVPRWLSIPQSDLAESLKPLSLKLGIEVTVEPVPGFEPIFEVLQKELVG